jgi:hypothetical protein
MCASARTFFRLRFPPVTVYIRILGAAKMVDTYRITLQGPEFMVSQNAGVTVGIFKTTHEAQLTVEDCERDDFMLQTASSLVNAAVEAHMRLHHIDRQAAHSWIREASD